MRDGPLNVGDAVSGAAIDKVIRAAGCVTYTNLEGSRLYFYPGLPRELDAWLNLRGRAITLRNFLVTQARL